jgi:hypothetical protein
MRFLLLLIRLLSGMSHVCIWLSKPAKELDRSSVVTTSICRMVLIMFVLCCLGLVAHGAAGDAPTVLALPMFGGEAILSHCSSRHLYKLA